MLQQLILLFNIASSLSSTASQQGKSAYSTDRKINTSPTIPEQLESSSTTLIIYVLIGSLIAVTITSVLIICIIVIVVIFQRRKVKKINSEVAVTKDDDQGFYETIKDISQAKVTSSVDDTQYAYIEPSRASFIATSNEAYSIFHNDNGIIQTTQNSAYASTYI